MSGFTLEKVLSDARYLVSRLKDEENTVNGLLTQTQELNKKVDSMKMYQENMDMLNEMARLRPHAELTIGIFQENSEIGELDRENAELRQALDEHQSAIELIMSRYRHQVTKLVTANRLDRARYTGAAPDLSEEVQLKVNQISKMADVMWSAVATDNSRVVKETELLAQARIENMTLREVLSAGRHSLASSINSRMTQTDFVDSDQSLLSAVNSTVVTSELSPQQCYDSSCREMSAVVVSDTVSTNTVPFEASGTAPTCLSAGDCGDVVRCEDEGNDTEVLGDSGTVPSDATSSVPFDGNQQSTNMSTYTLKANPTHTVLSDSSCDTLNSKVPNDGSAEHPVTTMLSKDNALSTCAADSLPSPGNEVPIVDTAGTVPCDVNTANATSTVPCDVETVSDNATSTVPCDVNVVDSVMHGSSHLEPAVCQVAELTVINTSDTQIVDSSNKQSNSPPNVNTPVV